MLARFPAPGAVALSGSGVSRYAAILGLTDRPIQTARSVMGVLRLSIATTDYDHFRDFRLGPVTAPGIDVTWSVLGHHEVFARFTAHREWDVAELSIAKFAAQVTRDEPDIVGLPVVCSRVFRFGAFYLNRRSGIETAEDLRGKRIGSPEWAHSAAVYMRGWLHNEVGAPHSRYTSDTTVMAVLLLDYYEGGNTGKTAAFSLDQTVILAVLLGLTNWLSRGSAQGSARVG